MMSNYELFRAPTLTYFGGYDSSEKLISAQEVIQSDNMKCNWQTAAPAVISDYHHFLQRIDVQEKFKTFQCKQCSFVAFTKEEFWEHNRTHIRADKLLACPKCPFVTEFKHHLEYHLRNHYGSKPFKCETCSYTCVNNSMLKSHLKSHSNVYQYRCSSCNYVTKYLHSLKIHLRRFQHEPGMVLNPDGTPNPSPIVDIYGTRRGPKLKPMDIQVYSPQNMQGQLQNMIAMFYSSMLATQMMIPGQILPIASAINRNFMNPMSRISGINRHPLNFINAMGALSSNQLSPGFPTAVPPLTNDGAMEGASNFNAFLDFMNEAMNVGKLPQEFRLNNHLPIGSFVSNRKIKVFENVIRVPVINVPKYEVNNSGGKVAPLDLSKPDSSNQQKKMVEDCPKASGTGRRKGKAVKLDKRTLEMESDDQLLL